MEEVKLMEQITRNMAKTFSQIHKLCIQKLKQLDSRDWSEYNYEIGINSKERSLGQSNGGQRQFYTGSIDIQKERQQRMKHFDYQRQKARKNKPKSPVSSFVIFCRDHREQILKEHPNCTAVEVTKIASKCWNELSGQQKQPYVKKYYVQKKIYDQELTKYYKEFPQQALKAKLDKNKKEKKDVKKVVKDKKVEEKKEVLKGNSVINESQNEYGSDDSQY